MGAIGFNCPETRRIDEEPSVIDDTKKRPPDATDAISPTGHDWDEEGVPRLRAVPEWLFDFQDNHDPRATRWLQAVLRFSRPDGSAIFGPVGRSPDRLRTLGALSKRLGDPSLSAVVARWLPSTAINRPASPPPSPSDSRTDRPLAILRADWTSPGEWVGVDHRRAVDATTIELTAKGLPWLGPDWSSGRDGLSIGTARPTSWTSGPLVESVEWSYRAGEVRVTRSATLLRGRSVAILGQQVDGPGSVDEVRLGLPKGVEASSVPGTRAVLLSSGRGKSTARLIPLGLPAHDRPTDLGSIQIEGREVVVRQIRVGLKSWLPVLVCWGKPPRIWRALTVSHRSKVAKGDQAVASRVAWGPRDEGLVVYRSLGPVGLRSFLGHQSGARFLVGAFTPSGDVRPILKVGG